MEINWIAVVVAALVRFFLGWAWHSPFAFGKQWQALTGVTDESMKANLGKAIPTDLVLSVIMAYVMARILGYAAPQDLVMALAISLMCWLGFVVSITLSHSVYEQKPLKLFMIEAAYMGLSMLGMGAVLYLMRPGA